MLGASVYLYKYASKIRYDKKELDSLKAYPNELSQISKTITVAYPVVSDIEAKYYAKIFYDISKQYKVDMPSFLALIKIESGWNPTLISSRKCRGLTQVSVAAATDECKKLGIEYKEGVTEWSDIANILIGLDYFSSRFQKSGCEYAIKSYIGGDGFKSATGANKEYIDRYTKEFMVEYVRVGYIYKGVKYDELIKK
jgi:soluble lytic murein transglycosylase-like protein